MLEFVDRVPWPIAVILALTLGLAPFLPEPHLVEKLRMLVRGELVRAMDILDLLYHLAPWLLVALKALRHWTR